MSKHDEAVAKAIAQTEEALEMLKAANEREERLIAMLQQARAERDMAMRRVDELEENIDKIRRRDEDARYEQRTRE